MKKKVLGILLALCAALSLAPVTALAAGGSAPTAVKSVGLGTSMLPNPEGPKDVDTAWEGSYVYYGIYKGEPIKSRMLSKCTTDFGGETMLPDCDTALWEGSKGDNPDGNKGIFGSTNVWADSDIRAYLNGTFLTKCFSWQEQAGIAPSTKTAPGASDGRGFISAVVGENEYISAMIVNDKNEVLNYGPLKAVDAAAGTVEMIIPFNIASGTYTLKLFNEHINGDFKTDYASAFADVTLSVNNAIGKNGEDGVTPILKIGTDNIWYVSYDKGATWTSLGTKATGEKGDKGETGATGAAGAAGRDGVTPQLKIGTDNRWYVSYDGGATWTSLGVSAADIKGDTGAAGKDGRDGLIPYIGSNGNWWIGGTDTGVRAAAGTSTATVIALAAAGAALAGNAALAAYVLSRRRKSAV